MLLHETTIVPDNVEQLTMAYFTNVAYLVFTHQKAMATREMSIYLAILVPGSDQKLNYRPWAMSEIVQLQLTND